MQDLYLYHNKEFVKESELNVGVTNRGFRFGDLAFESVRMANGAICFIDDHVDRFSKAMKALKMDIPKWFTVAETEKAFDKLKELNKLGLGGRARMTAYRNSGLTYKPEGNEVSILLEIRPYTDVTYVLNDKGLTIGVYNENVKHHTTFSQFKTGNSLLYTMAALYSTQHKFDEAIILNEDGRVVETTSSNIFMVKNGVLFTPPLSDGCIAGVMRRNLIEIAEEGGLKVKEQSMAPAAFETADEIFLTNTITGVRWVLSYGKRRYFNTTAKQLTQWLAESVE